jgi:hypothetical protein
VDMVNGLRGGWQTLSFGALHRNGVGCTKLVRIVSRLLSE